MAKDESLIFDRYESLYGPENEKKLFKVQFIKWDAKYVLPLCVVVDTVSSGTTVDKGLHLLNMEHFVPGKFRADVTKEAAEIVANGMKLYHGREDLREDLVLTIDPEESEDLDDALSIKPLDDDHFQITIHIADVSRYVMKDSAIDKEAKSRGTSYYPAGMPPVYMLPDDLTTDTCSLQPEKDSLTLSIFFTVNREFKIMDQDIKRCVIRSKVRLNYDEVETILDKSPPKEDNLSWSLHMLYRISMTWRKNHLGNASLHMALGMKESESPKAHVLVQELMIKANECIAQKLLKNFPKRTPLRIQESPNEAKLDEWKETYVDAARNSVVLKQPYLTHGRVCECRDMCSCMNAASTHSAKIVSVRRPIWQKITDSCKRRDTSDMIKRNIVNPSSIPDVEVAEIKLHQLQEQATYVCSGDISVNQQKHHTLLKKQYTHFTSPIRRYIDIIVHRLLSAILDNKPCPYTQEEVTYMCQHCTEAVQRANQYQKATEGLQFSLLVQKMPVTVHPVATSVTEGSIQTKTSHIRCLPAVVNRINMSMLQPCSEPFVDNNAAKIVWQERIYDTAVQMENRKPASHLQNELLLDPDKYTVQVQADLWQYILSAAVSEDQEDIMQACIEANQLMANFLPDSRYVKDVSSEVSEIVHAGQVCKFSLSLRNGSVMKVQLSAKMIKGLLTPSLQLVELTPTLQFCMQHRCYPVDCFIDSVPRKASKPTYRNIEEYKRLWLTLIQLEAAYGSVTDGETILIHNVHIKWRLSEDNHNIIGTFELDSDFCKNRTISFSSSAFGDNETEEAGVGETLDFFCIRYHGQLCHSLSANKQLQQYGINTTEPVTWVVHCVSTAVVNDKARSTVKVTIKLIQNTCTSVPQEFIAQTRNQNATLELIPKALPSRREENALAQLCEKSPLAYDIALGHKLQDLSPAHVAAVEQFKNKKIDNIPPANADQQKAIDKSLTQPFTLIQGPPGTGKTVTGVRLAITFALFNKTQLSNGKVRPQVMYCGPSNKSVDVVAAYLSKQGTSCPGIVRVYNKLIEREDFPLPMDVLGVGNRKKSSYIKDDKLNAITLHHIIRDKTQCSMAPAIRKLDEIVRHCIDTKIDLLETVKKSYHDLIHEAKLEVLRKKEIILCTCHSSGAEVISAGTNVKQLIIDECGMCKEPESMVPIVATKPQQVILIGDHKQLRPIVRNETAKIHGLERSLFERHSKHAIMLTVQYRMHEAIAEFPSSHFYQGQLQNGTAEQRKASNVNIWPNDRKKPIVFVHTVGCEETLSVSTDVGSERSKSNMKEVDKTVDIVSHMVNYERVKQDQILILSQYRAQVFKLLEKLKQCGLQNVSVDTVIAAQGSERDYVLLSTVRSLPKSHIDTKAFKGWQRRYMGFITDEHQINVALTRAKKGFIIIGNKNLLECHPMWRNLLEHYHKHGKIVNADQFIP